MTVETMTIILNQQMSLKENLNILQKIHKCTKSSPSEEEVTKIVNNGNESAVSICYKIKFFDSARFMATAISNLVTEKIQKIKCKDCDCFSENEIVKCNLIK